MTFLMLETVRQTLQKFQLVPAGATVVIGVSGGKDSLALLHLLNQLAVRMRFEIHAATLDHQLRGEQSKADVDYVADLCRKWSIPVTTGSVDVPAIMREQHLGVETAARLARYRFLAEVAHSVGAQRIVVAHHANDQAETVLMRLLRGTGTHGLVGMSLQSPMPYDPALILIRPLLNITRQQIDVYCQENNLVPRDDDTNQDLTLLRNAIRLHVLPFLSQYNSNLYLVLSRVAENAALDEDYLNQALIQFVNSGHVTSTEQQVGINREQYCNLHPALQRRLLIWSLERLNVIENLSHDRILDTVAIGTHGHQGALSLLGNGVHLRVDYDILYVEFAHEVRDREFPLLNPNEEIAVDIPGSTPVGRWVLETSHKPLVGDRVGCIAFRSGARFTLRTRRDGDRFLPKGLQGHTQKLSRWMINRKIEHSVRDNIPLLCFEDTIAAICINSGWIVGEEFAVTDALEPVVYFKFHVNL